MPDNNHLNSAPRNPELHPGHALNRAWWDEATPIHTASEFYDVNGFLQGKPALDRLECDWLGEVAGKRALHLQCHFGKSTIEIARLGAAHVVGVDFSPVALAAARDLAQQAGVADRVSFIESDVLLLDRHLSFTERGLQTLTEKTPERGLQTLTEKTPERGLQTPPESERFDVIFTSYGVLNWLSDLNRWGEVIARLLAPTGRFVIVEIHPALMIFDWENGKLERKYGYFHCEAGLELPPTPDYADNSYIPKSATREWQWSLADVFRALTRAGLRVTKFEEYPTCCFKPFPHMVESGELFMLPPGEPDLPMTFALEAKV